LRIDGTSAALRRGALTMGLGGVLAIGAVMPATAQDMPFESKIRLKNTAPAFHGKVKSDSPSCIAGRKVRMFRAKKGEDKVLGKTRTDAQGKWQVLHEPKSGVYYAKVNEFAQEESQLVCLPDKSKKLVID